VNGAGVAGRVDHAFTCAECRESPPAFEKGRSLYRYEGGVRDAIHALKYHRDFSVVPDLSRLLLAGIQTHFEDSDSLTLAPVPLHWRRRWRREFNQAEELVRGIRKHAPAYRVWRGLRRVRHTDTQTRLSKAARRVNVRGAFAVARNRAVPARVLLIDDVMTTGATLNAAANALRKAGAEHVFTLTLARG